MSSVWYSLSLSSGPLCFPACLLHSSLSSPAASGQRYHYTTRQTVTLVHLYASSICMDNTQRCYIKVDGDAVFPTNYVPSLSKMWTCRPPSVLSHRHLKLQTTPRLFIQALKHSSGPPTSLHYSVRLLTHTALLTAAA